MCCPRDGATPCNRAGWEQTERSQFCRKETGDPGGQEVQHESAMSPGSNEGLSHARLKRYRKDTARLISSA